MKIKTRLAGHQSTPSDRLLVLERVNLEDADYSGRRLNKLTIVASTFSDCCFEDMTIDDAGFGSGTGESKYTSCSFDRSSFRWLDPGRARFERCSFRNVVVDEIFSDCGEFVDCVFSGRFKKGVFRGMCPPSTLGASMRRVNEFRGNDFRDADLNDVGFRGGIDLSKQSLPRSSDYVVIWNAVRVLPAVRDVVVSWKDMDRRRRALPILAAMQNEIQDGQQQLFTKPDDFYGPRHRDADVTREVFELLIQHDGSLPSSTGSDSVPPATY